MIETNYVPIYMKINQVFFVIKGQFHVMDFISNTIYCISKYTVFMYYLWVAEMYNFR